MFGGLISCVRTFGDQVINGIKTFKNDLYANLLSIGDRSEYKVSQYKISSGDYVTVMLDQNNLNWFSWVTFFKDGRISFFPYNYVTVSKSPNISDNSGTISTTSWANAKIKDKCCLYPDYANAITQTNNQDYTAAADGWLFWTGQGGALIVEGLTVCTGSFVANMYIDTGHILVPIKAGQTYKSTGGTLRFIPNLW